MIRALSRSYLCGVTSRSSLDVEEGVCRRMAAGSYRTSALGRRGGAIIGAGTTVLFALILLRGSLFGSIGSVRGCSLRLRAA